MIFTDGFDAALLTAMENEATLFAWASKLRLEHEAAAAKAGIAITRIEDGFLRSAGLGAGLTPGASYAFDETGIYYDATRPSDIERLLETAALSAEDSSAGGELIALIAKTGVTKYNVGEENWRADLPAFREKILVPGQVGDDASLQRCMAGDELRIGVNANLALLRAVRRRNPKAFIIYKPHPDVEGGLRHGHIEPVEALRHADLIAAGVSVLPLIERCDAVETISSLTGFEALLRGRKVTAHGLPFYAGWGLTEDLVAPARRTRRRTRAELVFIALMRYCRHVHPRSNRPCSAHDLATALAELRRNPAQRMKAAALQRISWAGRKLGL